MANVTIYGIHGSYGYVRTTTSEDWHQKPLYRIVKSHVFFSLNMSIHIDPYWSIYWSTLFINSYEQFQNPPLPTRLYWSLDILFSFTTGFYDAGLLVLNLRRTSMNYLTLGLRKFRRICVVCVVCVDDAEKMVWMLIRFCFFIGTWHDSNLMILVIGDMSGQMEDVAVLPHS